MADSIGHLFLQRRRGRGLTQSEVARDVGCSASHVSNIEREYVQPDESLAYAIGRVLGITRNEVGDHLYGLRSPVERAITEDGALNAQGKRILLAAYRAAAKG